MAIAAVPDYLGTDFGTASPGLRFGMYLSIWNARFSETKSAGKSSIKIKGAIEPLKKAGKLNPNDKTTMKYLLARQQTAFRSVTGAADGLQLDAIATAPFTTGLGNEHPTENGFAFLNPYGLPYLPGSGVKGVLREAARELATGDWGESGWSDDYITALFGSEPKAETLKRGAFIFWDVIPQIKGDNLTVEIMTPHQAHYYQNQQTPHDSGQPTPISFLTVPAGSGFTFHVQCDLTMLNQSAPELAQGGRWKTLLEAAFSHAFDWLGFGAKTSVGYGAMQEDQVQKIERERQQAEQQEQERRATLSPEDLAYEENKPVIDKFRETFEQARKVEYQPGQEFDGKRNEFIKEALLWDETRSRIEAADVLEETIKWGVSKKGKDRLKTAVDQLRRNKD